MKQIITIDYYFQNLEHIPIIDVRSPGEFAKGHIPGAKNIDLFTDNERAIVGTAYKKQSKEKAVELGYTYVKPKLSDFVTKSLAAAPHREIVIHCWRGGMRSNAFADHLLANEFAKVYVIEGGYKAFRSYVLESFNRSFNLKILGGYTGTGKTEILHYLEKKGQQVVDLEGLASHRGSAFGGIDLPPQITTEQFENKLFSKLKDLNPKEPVWVEDESKTIGYVSIPNQFYFKMRNLPVYFLDVPLEKRIAHLVDSYANLSQDKLADAISRIAKKLGYDKAKFALDALRNKDYYKVVEIVLFYYDKYYLRGLQKRQESTVQHIEINSANHEEIADILISLTNQENG